MTKSHKKTTKHGSHHHHGAKKNNSQGWQIATIVLAILLVASIFTGGFQNTMDANEDADAQEIAQALVQAGVITQTNLNSATETIEDALEAEAMEEEKVPKYKNQNKPVVEDALSVELYVMSQCPYGVQVEEPIFTAIRDIGEENFDLAVDYISTPLGDGTFQSLHGQPETDGNIVQLCANEIDSSKFMDFVLCMNENPQAIPGNWESCSDKVDLDTEAVRTCFEGEQGVELLTNSANRAQEAGASGSPTIILDGARYSGGRGVNDFKRAFCNAFEGARPAGCADIPEPMKFDVVVLNDERCADCKAAQDNLIGQLKGLFPGMQVETIDYMSEEGKKLYADTNSQNLPALLFDEKIADTENYDRVQPYLQAAGDYQTLLIGATHDPTKEICDNNVDDTGNGNVDCADNDCKDSMVCRETIEQQLQVFIMSDCPYGRKAVEALKDVKDNFEDELEFEIHYIANENGNGFDSLHGQYEVDENIKQLCVLEHSPDVWFDYMYCRSVNGVRNVDWDSCAAETNVDVDAVTACFEGEEGANLLREDIKIANALGIGASPTWLANNKYQFSGIDAETVKSNFCQYNTNVEGCENTLSSDTGGVPAGSC